MKMNEKKNVVIVKTLAFHNNIIVIHIENKYSNIKYNYY